MSYRGQSLSAAGFDQFCEVLLRRNAQAVAAKFRPRIWKNAGLGTLHDVAAASWFDADSLAIAQSDRSSPPTHEQRDFHRRRIKNPSRNLPLSLASGTGVVIALASRNFIYLSALPLWEAPLEPRYSNVVSIRR